MAPQNRVPRAEIGNEPRQDQVRIAASGLAPDGHGDNHVAAMREGRLVTHQPQDKRPAKDRPGDKGRKRISRKARPMGPADTSTGDRLARFDRNTAEMSLAPSAGRAGFTWSTSPIIRDKLCSSARHVSATSNPARS
jgi:hypothetical protein